MKSLTAIIVASLLCGVALFSGGCAQPAVVVGGAGTAMAVAAATYSAEPGTVVGVADTNAERQERLKEVHNIGWRQLVDDWDAFWLNDRATRLSEYPVR
jgi:hypothetical protein